MMLSYHLDSKFIIIICDSVNFAFLYFNIKIKINHTHYFQHIEMNRFNESKTKIYKIYDLFYFVLRYVRMTFGYLMKIGNISNVFTYPYPLKPP